MVSYDIHLDSPGPFGSTLNADHGFFNWAMVLMYSPALRTQPVSIRLLDVPATWGLRDLHVLGAAGPGKVSQLVGVARNYDELVDSPAEVGTFRESAFQQDGATYHVVVDGNPADYDMAKLDELLRKITHAAVDWMQDRPYDEYTFLYHFPRGPGGGGMEHAYGTAIDVNAERLRDESLLPLASVSAHEFFHLWNVKRIRPQSLEPIDYQRENDTRALWFSEGVTSTVGDMLLARAGLIDERRICSESRPRSPNCSGVPRTRWQSAEESSLDAWFEGIRVLPLAGAQHQLLQQGRDSRRSAGPAYSPADRRQEIAARPVPVDERPLRQAASLLSRFAGVEEAAEAITGQSFTEFFRDYVAGVKEIPYDEFFQFAGLHVDVETIAGSDGGIHHHGEHRRAAGGRCRSSPAAKRSGPGIAAGDRMTAVNGKPADASSMTNCRRCRRERPCIFAIENRKRQT